jgi:hypothetical protein
MIQKSCKNGYHLLEIVESSKPEKKLMALFVKCKTGRSKTVHFGSNGMSDYTINRDSNRKKLYISRHSKREDWNDPISAGALSRWVLWNKYTIEESILDYKKRFSF